MKPIRIQLKRTKGWRMPANTVKVTRPGKWGNPLKVGGWFRIGDVPGYRGPFTMSWCQTTIVGEAGFTLIKDAAMAVEWFARYMESVKRDFSELRGKNLACFCALDSPCHVDVLLKLANQ